MVNKPTINTINQVYGFSKLSKQKQVESTILAKNVNSILEVMATPVLKKVEKDGKFIKLDGLTYIKIMFEDNDGNICVVDNKCNFTEIMEVNDCENYSVNCQVNLNDLDFKVVNNDEIKVSAVLNFEASIFKQKDVQYVDCMNDFCVLPNEINLTTVILNDNVSYNESFEVDLGKNIARVLDCYANVSPKNITTENGNINLQLCVSATLTYELADENMTLSSHTANFDFTKSIAVDGCYEDCKAICNTSLQIDKLQVICEEVDGNMLAKIELPLLTQYVCLKNVVVQSVLDAYSISNELNISKTSVNSVDLQNEIFVNEKIDTNVVITDERKTIEKVYSYVCNSVDLTKLLVENNDIIVEGVAYCTILYKSFDRENELTKNDSIITEIPFATTVKQANISQGDLIVGNATPMNCDVRIKRNQELDIIAEIKLHILALQEHNLELVNDIEIGQEKEINVHPLNIYLVQKGKSYWDIAKELSVEIEELQNQNIEVNLPSDKIERIIYYKQK